MLKDKGREALEELMNEAQMIAAQAMRHIGDMPATLFIHGQEGNVIFRPESMESAAAKDRFAADSRVMCVAHAADAVVFCTEAWMLVPKNDKPLDLSVAPSQSPDKQEVLIFLGESRDGRIHRSIPIVRAENGKFAGFDEANEIRPDKVEGRFSQFLTEHIPTEQDREVAKLLLAVKGIAPMEKKEEQDRHRGLGRSRF